MNKYLAFCFILLIALFIIVVVALWQGLDSFLFAWILNFMLMMSLLSFTETFRPKFISVYYDSKKWENEGKIYKWLGINVFRKLLVLVGWEKLNKSADPVKKNPEALKHLEYNTRQSEFGHLIIFFIVFAIAVFVGFYYGLIKSLWLHFLNVLLNAFPIGVQRYNRPRLQKIISSDQNVFLNTPTNIHK